MHELRFSCDDLTLFHTADRQTNAARSATFIFSKNVAPRQLSNIHTSPSPSKHISTVLKATASPSLNSTHHTPIISVYEYPVFFACLKFIITVCQRSLLTLVR